jgi:hypothetical protein
MWKPLDLQLQFSSMIGRPATASRKALGFQAP